MKMKSRVAWTASLFALPGMGIGGLLAQGSCGGDDTAACGSMGSGGACGAIDAGPDVSADGSGETGGSGGSACEAYPFDSSDPVRPGPVDAGSPSECQDPNHVIQGRDMTPIPDEISVEHAVAEAKRRALQAIDKAIGSAGLISSYEGDPGAQTRSFSWDQCLAFGALLSTLDDAASGTSATDDAGTAARASELAAQVAVALLRTQLPSGAWPIMRLLANGELLEPGEAGVSGGDLTPAPSQTACIIGLFAHVRAAKLLEDYAADIDGALKRAAAWMDANWLDSGGFAIWGSAGEGESGYVRGTRASTEGTAMALLAMLARARLDPAGDDIGLRDRIEQTRSLLANVLWQRDHFARGIAEDGAIDDDQTGPHTHQFIPVLAVRLADRWLGASAAVRNPLPWMLRNFLRTVHSESRVVRGIGDRMTFADPQGILYGCEGMRVLDAVAQLNCEMGLTSSDPREQCYSPFGIPGVDACIRSASTPSNAHLIENVNSELTALGALAAMALGNACVAGNLMTALLAMQQPDGAVIAIAGPDDSAPGVPLAWFQTHRIRQYGYTSLALSTLLGRNPFTPSDKLAAAVPDNIYYQPPRFSTVELVLTALAPDPRTGGVTVSSEDNGDTVVRLEYRTRNGANRSDAWVRFYTLDDRDNFIPAQCYDLAFDLRGEGPWSVFQLTAQSVDNPNYGRIIYGAPIVGSGNSWQLYRIPLGTLKPWDTSTAEFRPHQLSFAVSAHQDDVFQDDVPGAVELRNPRLERRASCVEGAPLAFEPGGVEEGECNRMPKIHSGGEDAGISTGLVVDFDVQGTCEGNALWQQVVSYDRWDWSCAASVRLRYAADQVTKLQLKLQDDRQTTLFVERNVESVTSARQIQFLRTDFGAFDSTQGEREFHWGAIRQISVALPSEQPQSRIGRLILYDVDAVAGSVDDLDGRCVCME